MDVPKQTLSDCYRQILNLNENLVLIGMPSSGKSTVGELLAKRLNREFVDIDKVIESKAGISIERIFREYGESRFRKLESDAISSISKTNSKVIASGGGSILSKENVRNLKMNGKLILLERNLELLTPGCGRPLSQTYSDIESMYIDRMPIYRAAADLSVDNNVAISECIDTILQQQNPFSTQ